MVYAELILPPASLAVAPLTHLVCPPCLLLFSTMLPLLALCLLTYKSAMVCVLTSPPRSHTEILIPKLMSLEVEQLEADWVMRTEPS